LKSIDKQIISHFYVQGAANIRELCLILHIE
jgi:hypothetical protein